MRRSGTVRCAIYTRKSSEEGLEQEFNSLQAQREACEAFIVSQRHEGWVCRHAVYDDVGFSGATIDRPASASAIRSPARNAALGFLSPIRTQQQPVSLSRPHPPAVRYWNMARQRYYRAWA